MRYCLNNPLIYTDPDGEEFSWLAAGIFAIFTYFKTAHNNRDKETGKWAWNPVDWFKKGNNTNIQIGVNTNSSLSNFTFFAGIGSNNDPISSIAYNTQYGVGIGNNNSGLNDFYYPNHDPEAAVQTSMAKFEESRSRLVMNDKYNFAKGEIRQWTPNWIDKWSESTSFWGDLSYLFFDGIYVTVQSFIIGPESRHLTGEYVVGNDRVDAFINTAAWTGVAYEMSAYKAIQGGVYYERLSLRIQIHTHGRAPLPGRGVSGKIYATHININKIHIYLNPKMWKYFYPWWPWY